MSKNVKCSERKESRVIYAAKKLKSDEHAKLQKLLKTHIYICGTSFADINENPVAYVRENLSCSVPIEIPYYGVDFPNICIYCGSPKNPRAIEPQFYPQCKHCSGERRKRRKRKVTEASLKDAKKKK